MLYDAIQFLFLLAQRDVLLSQQTKSAPATPPAPYNSHSTPSDDEKLQRQRVREELVTTEKDYYQEMSAFCTKVLPAFKQVIILFILL